MKFAYCESRFQFYEMHLNYFIVPKIIKKNIVPEILT